MTHPYSSLPKNAFWAPSVAQLHMLDIGDLWSPRFELSKETQIATFGSCFAQHFSKALKRRGLSWLDCEPAPNGISEATANLFNYGVFSARTANIYTTSLFFQWVQWALRAESPPDIFWKNEQGRFVDPFRPTIEPYGFVSLDELIASRWAAIDAFKRCLTDSDLFVFTLGLTESWFDSEFKVEYPLCPGTIGGGFNPLSHVFRNQTYTEVYDALNSAISLIRAHRVAPLQFLLTVSPVPLVATNSGNHVLVATMESKSILRAVAGTMPRSISDLTYFPSFEIISSPVYRGFFFEPNMRGVNQYGVDHVMNTFFSGFSNFNSSQTGSGSVQRGQPSFADEIACEEEMLSAFGNDT